MARPLLVFAVVALVGMAVLRFLLGLASVAGFLFGLLVKLAIVAAIIYLGIRVFSPETARKMREHFTGPST